MHLLCARGATEDSAHDDDADVQIINGAALSSVNAATLQNPACLAEFVELGRALRAETL